MSGKAFLDHFSAFEDPRQAAKVIYPVPELLLVLCATLCGAEDLVEITRWGKRKLDFLRRLLPFEHGIPSHDALNDMMNALPAPLCAAYFTVRVEGLRDEAPDIIAIDGIGGGAVVPVAPRKPAGGSRRSNARGNAPLHMVSA